MDFFILALLISGIGQGFLGLKQIYGFSASHHSLYAVTGSFFNPGPYGGYMAFIFCVAASYLAGRFHRLGAGIRTRTENRRYRDYFRSFSMG